MRNRPASPAMNGGGVQIPGECRPVSFAAAPRPDARFHPVLPGQCRAGAAHGAADLGATSAAPSAGIVAAIGMGALDVLMPLHLLLGPGGEVAGCGRTLRKVLGQGAQGCPFGELFTVRQPEGIRTVAALRATAGEQLRLSLTGADEAGFHAVAVPLGGDGGVLLNLSFGLGLIKAVGAHGLTDADFAPTDPVIDLLWMAEAKTWALGASRGLIARLQEARHAAEDRALTDTLTGLRNRRALESALADLAASGAVYALMHMDLDHFKQVNDSLGHAAGDAVLRQVGGVLAGALRRGDMAARVGGDEFVALLPGLTDHRHLSRIADRLVAQIARPVVYNGAACQVGASIGIAVSDGRAGFDALAAADGALYAAKRAGRGRAVFADTTGAASGGGLQQGQHQGEQFGLRTDPAAGIDLPPEHLDGLRRHAHAQPDRDGGMPAQDQQRDLGLPG